MNFEYKYSAKGMSEQELLFHANYSPPLLKYSILDSERYGCGKYLRKYGFYHRRFPLRLHTDHGPGQWDIVVPHMFDSSADYFGLYSERLLLDWNQKSKKKAFVIKAPFVIGKEKLNITKSPNAVGALFFHSHSTFWTDKETDYDMVFGEIAKLPTNFHPFGVCMFFVDIIKGRHKPYMEKGIPVFTAGHWNHPFFIENFYEIIRHYNYAFSNSIGSQIFYCVDLGLPFSVINGAPVTTHDTDPNTIKSNIDYHSHRQIIENYRLFSGVFEKITEEQSQFVREELGIEKGIRPVKMFLVLYWSLCLFCIRKIKYKLFNKDGITKDVSL